MKILYILLISLMLSGGIIYSLYRLTSSSRVVRKKTKPQAIDLEIDETLIEDVDGSFVGTVYRKAEHTVLTEKEIETQQKGYPKCFGTIDAFNTCSKDCEVVRECTSTVNILKGF